MRLLLESKKVSQAYRLAEKMHKGQLDKGGHAYMGHLIAVAESMDTEEAQTVGLLHDIVEDTPMTLAGLLEHGFSEREVRAVDCLTKRDGEPLMDYLVRVKQDPLATKVKLADLKNNSDLSRIPAPSEKDLARAERYQKEIEFLRQGLHAEELRNAHN